MIRPRDYRLSLPGPEDVLLLIEVSDTTLAYDRGMKLPIYARAGTGSFTLQGRLPLVTPTPQRKATSASSRSIAARRWSLARYPA